MITHNQTTKPSTIEELANDIYNQALEHSIKVCQEEMGEASHRKDSTSVKSIRTIILNLHKLKK